MLRPSMNLPRMMHAAVPLSFCYYCEGKPLQNPGICTTGSLSTAARFRLTGLPLKNCPRTTGRGCAVTEIPDSAPLRLDHPQNELDNAMNDRTHHQEHWL
jgi:hypothetical protein